jgi:hypothetical protein
MIIAHYAHRLPVNRDMAQIRTRARERGRYGAIANNYSSL